MILRGKAVSRLEVIIDTSKGFQKIKSTANLFFRNNIFLRKQTMTTCDFISSFRKDQRAFKQADRSFAA